MGKVLSDNKYNLPKNDLYGRLYFYLVDQLKKFVKLIATKKVVFYFYNDNALNLLQNP